MFETWTARKKDNPEKMKEVKPPRDIFVRCPTYLAIACVWFRTPLPATTRAGKVPKVKAPEEYIPGSGS